MVCEPDRVIAAEPPLVMVVVPETLNTSGSGLTVIVIFVLTPEHDPYCGVTVIVAVTGFGVLLLAVNDPIAPVPLAAKPIPSVLLDQVNDVAVPAKLTGSVGVPLHIVCTGFVTLATVGVGLTIMVALPLTLKDVSELCPGLVPVMDVIVKVFVLVVLVMLAGQKAILLVTGTLPLFVIFVDVPSENNTVQGEPYILVPPEFVQLFSVKVTLKQSPLQIVLVVFAPFWILAVMEPATLTSTELLVVLLLFVEISDWQEPAITFVNVKVLNAPAPPILAALTTRGAGLLLLVWVTPSSHLKI